jgi:heat shock protein HtpX
MTRRELFPLDRVLVARMLATAVLTPLVVAAALLMLVLVAPWKIVAGVAVACVLGVGAAVKERRDRPAAVELTPEAAPDLHATVERLCVVADLPKPRLVLEPETQPNSWVVSLGRGRSRLHLTQGLVDRLTPAELEGVVAHELAHLAQRDAVVMTVVGGPGAALLSGGGELARHGAGFWLLGVGGAVACAIGWVGTLGARILSRHRELAADAGAVALTGNPAALASALTKVSAALAVIPAADLRVAAARDAFHLLPAARPGARRSGVPLPATHPPLPARIARLERIEARLQSARRLS